MPINHSQRLLQPKHKTVIDPVTQKIVFYSDYLKMEQERVENAHRDSEGSNDENGSQITERQKNSGADDGDGWSSEHEFGSEDEDGAANDEEPNKEDTDSVLLLGNTTITQDNIMQAKLAAALNKKTMNNAWKFFKLKQRFVVNN